MIMAVGLTDLKIAGGQRSDGSGHDEIDDCNSLNMQFRTVSLYCKLEVCALCGDADPRRVCRELHSV